MWGLSLLYEEMEKDLHFWISSAYPIFTNNNKVWLEITLLGIRSDGFILPYAVLSWKVRDHSLLWQVVSFCFSFTRSQFSIRLKTRSSHGMIFYVSDQEENDFMTLFLAHGRLVFMFNVGHKKLKIRSQEKYNDGLWHDVSWRQRILLSTNVHHSNTPLVVSLETSIYKFCCYMFRVQFQKLSLIYYKNLEAYYFKRNIIWVYFFWQIKYF